MTTSMLQFRMRSDQTSPAQLRSENPRSFPQCSENLRARSHWGSGICHGCTTILPEWPRTTNPKKTFLTVLTFIATTTMGFFEANTIFSPIVGFFPALTRPAHSLPAFSARSEVEIISKQFIFCSLSIF